MSKISDKDDKISKSKISKSKISDKDDKISKSKISDKDDKISKSKISDKDDKCSNIDLSIFNDKIEEKIKNIFEAKKSVNVIEDILLNEYFSKHIKEIKNSLIIKQIQMKIGNIWQIAIGNYGDFRDLGIGHHTGLDIKNKNRKIIIELKNRYNTDNSSSKKSNFDKLANYKKEHSDFECIYAIVNDTRTQGQRKIIIHNGVEIVYLSGMQLLEYIFVDNTTDVLNILHKIISSYLS
jgi:hypothetical protein